MRIKANHRTSRIIRELFEKNAVQVDGATSREISRILGPLRRNGNLIVGYDQRLNRSVLYLEGIYSWKKRKGRGWGSSIFDVVTI